MAGHVLYRYLNSLDKYEMHNSSRSKLNEKTIILDIFNIQKVENLIRKLRPDVIINCIGILVKESNENPDKAIFVNSYFPHYLERITRETSSKLVHLSTDCVFSGEDGNYTEDIIPDGQDYYAKSKALSEIINKKDLTIRTSIIGPELKKKGNGLFHWFMNQKTKVNGYKNVLWTGVTTLQLAKAIDKGIEKNLNSLYHLVPESKISKYSLLKLISKIWNKNIKIKPVNEPKSDKSLVNTRKDFDYIVPNYEKMVKNLYKWMNNWNYRY